MRFCSLILVLAATGIQAATTNTAADTTLAAVQTAYNLCNDGDTLAIPSGSSAWAGALTVTKGISIIGAGTNSTFISRGATSGYLIDVTTSPAACTRISGINFSETTADRFMEVVGEFTNALARIDRCVFSTTSGGAILVVWFKTFGVVDHCSFFADDTSEILHNEAWGAENGGNGWTNAITQLTTNAMYVEDCAFWKYDQSDPYFWGCSAIQSYYGGNTVMRYNSLHYCQIDQHGTAGSIGARWWEIYENDFYCPNNSGQSDWMQLRAGSGVCFTNRFHVGSGATVPALTLMEEDSGYPALYQIGRGKDQALDPAYFWGNDATPYNATPTMIELDRDYYLSVKAGYTPYTYPHPLVTAQDGGGEPPSATATVLRVTTGKVGTMKKHKGTP